MSRIMEIILNIALFTGVQIIVYVLFLRPKILTWGTVGEEATMPLIGDDLAPRISATRAISIDAPASEVWKWVIQLGADRGGFFSYSLLERALGYEMHAAESLPGIQEMEVGRIVPASLDESKSAIKFNFPVVAVEPGKSFVLENWGTFAVKETDVRQSRLIVRTHGSELPNLKSKVADFVGEALHYIMERRMLMGIKARVEGSRLSEASDDFWLLGIGLSGLGIALIILFGHGIQNTLLSILYGILWLLAFLILEPRPGNSMTLLLLEVATIVMNNIALAGKSSM